MISNIEQWKLTLPELQEQEFFIPIVHEDNHMVFCVKEIDWQTAMQIDMKSFRVNEKGVDYYSEEYERRHTLNHAIIWCAHFESNTLLRDKILINVQFEILDELWHLYQNRVSVSVREAQTLHDTTLKYLRNEAQEGVPLPPIIPETIAICDGWAHLSITELKCITASDWERMQIVKKARAEHLSLFHPSQIRGPGIDINEKPKSSNDVFSQYPIGHPNRPPVF